MAISLNNHENRIATLERVKWLSFPKYNLSDSIELTCVNSNKVTIPTNGWLSVIHTGTGLEFYVNDVRLTWSHFNVDTDDDTFSVLVPVNKNDTVWFNRNYESRRIILLPLNLYYKLRGVFKEVISYVNLLK